MTERKHEELDKPRPVELSEKAKENLRRMAEWRRGGNKFITLQPSEEFCKLFEHKKMIPVEKVFDGKHVQRFQYVATDPNTRQEKYWEVSERTSEQINAFLNKGHNLLKVQRFGSGKDTRYNIFPA